MEIKQLQGLVLLFVLVGMILGVGVLVIDRFSYAARDTTTAMDGSVNVTAGVLSNSYCLSLTEMVVTGEAVNLVANLTLDDADTCAYTADVVTNQTYNITYTYKADSASQTVADATNDAIAPISTTWMPLIVTVAILAIILTLVIGSFSGTR